jgi:two-component system sensor histidine kinase HydH
LSQNHLQLLRAERLVALGGLAASFIHDLKAPLVSIGLMARAAAARLAEGDATRASLEKIARETVEIEVYLKDLAKSAARGASEKASIDFSAVIQNSLELMRGWMITRNVEPVLRMNHGDARVHGNPVEFRQVILNLMHNSMEAMPDGGVLTFETASEGDELLITVRDSGVGIPDDAKSRIFSVFYTTKPEGSGLGLFLVKRIVTDHGGTIAFNSKEGEGTCFSIRLPVRDRRPGQAI